MRHRLVPVSAVVVALLLAVTPGLAQGSEAPPPPADLISVSAHVTFPTASQGTADEGSCFISNVSPDPVTVRLDTRVVWSDGSVQRLTGISDPGVLNPGDAFELNVFFVVPPDAPLGTATWVCDASAQSLTNRRQRENEVATATFDVVP